MNRKTKRLSRRRSLKAPAQAVAANPIRHCADSERTSTTTSREVDEATGAPATIGKRNRFLSWCWGQRWNVWSGFFRCVTLLSVGYLVYDRIYETDVVLGVAASDPEFAFEFPFTLTNTSHLFTVRNVRWTCRPIDIVWPENMRITGKGSVSRESSSAQIAPGETVNSFNCSFVGPRGVMETQKVKLQRGVVALSVSYDADLFGIVTLHRNPPETVFQWTAGASNPQWVKGTFR